MREKVPKIVGKLRYLVRRYPDQRDKLMTAANRLILAIKSLNTPPEYWQHMAAYGHARKVVKEVCGEDWIGE